MDFIQQYPMLVHNWHHSKTIWAVKNKDSHYVYGNLAWQALLNLPDTYSLAGRRDQELPTPSAEFFQHFVAHDTLTMEKKCRISAISCHFYANSTDLQPYLFDKYPFIDEHGVQGVIISAQRISAIHYLFYVQQQAKKHLLLYPPTPLFTNREWQIIFLMCCGLDNREIAHTLSLSFRTVENRVQRCFDKSNTFRRSTFLERCRHEGWHNYMPPFFLQKKYLLLDG